MNKDIKNFYDKTFVRLEEPSNAGETSVPASWIRVFYKTYPRLEQIPLAAAELGQENLQEALQSRQSVRTFNRNLTFEELSTLLHYSAGISNKNQEDLPRRTYPSAGARYPVEIYVLNRSIKGLPKGAHHYNVKSDILEVLLEEDISELIDEMLQGQEGALKETLSALIIMTTVVSRAEVKYGINAYPFSLIEAGHIGQNISLSSHAQNTGSCPLGIINRNIANEILDLTDEELVIYSVALGGL